MNKIMVMALSLVFYLILRVAVIYYLEIESREYETIVGRHQSQNHNKPDCRIQHSMLN